MSSGKLAQRLIPPAMAFAAIVLGAGAAPSMAEEFSRGQALYENHCQSCHTDWAHARSGRKVTSLNELHRRVASWSIHAGLDWSDEEVGDVTEYLEANFYRFGDEPE